MTPQAAQYRQLLQAQGAAVPPLETILAIESQPILGFPVAATEAVGTWEALRAITERTGLYPVVFADEHGLVGGEDLGYGSLEEILAEAGRIDPAKRLKRRAEEELEGLEEGEWEDAQPQSEFTLPFDVLSGEPREDVKIVLLPTRSPWEAAAHLRWAACNYDLNPELHVAVHRYWHERYGAELVCAGGEILEMRVARPPRDRAAAVALAREQGGYCPDIITQGTGSVQALAASLLGAPVWYFWWD